MFTGKVKAIVSYETLNLIKHSFTWTEFLLIILVVSIAFPIRYVFQTELSFATGIYSDFTAISIYLSDIVLLLLVVLNLRSFTRNNLYIFSTWCLFTIISLFAYSSEFHMLGLFVTVKYLFLAAMVLTIRDLKDSFVELLGKIIITLAFLQSFFGGLQFISQSSLGLRIFGESVLHPDMLGVAKIVAHGTELIRSYGTFPHPNLLAAFLLIGFMWNIYLLIYKPHKYRLFYFICLVFTTWGIILTFSRSAWLVATTWGIIILSRGVINRSCRIKSHLVTLVIILSLATGLFTFWPEASSRFNLQETTDVNRTNYQEIGARIIENALPFGTGLGKSIMFMRDFSDDGLQSWEIQPIHNYILLGIAELGLFSIMLFYIIFKPFFALVKQQIGKFHKSELAFNISMIGLAIFVLMLFDHYFYTIEQGRLLLWIFVLIAYNQAKNLNKDSTYGNPYQL